MSQSERERQTEGGWEEGREGEREREGGRERSAHYPTNEHQEVLVMKIEQTLYTYSFENVYIQTQNI